jgi:hypothetical protein
MSNVNSNGETYTSFYWSGSEVERTVFTAGSVRLALESYYEMGWSCYDDRRLVKGDVRTSDAYKHPRLIANESWGEDD